MAISLLNRKEYRVTDTLTVYIPTLGQYRGYNSQTKDVDPKIREQYESLMNLFLLTPSNYMLQLHKIGRDFRKITEYDFFIELFYAEFIYAQTISAEVIDSRILFNVDFRELSIVEDEKGHILIVNDKDETIIDEWTYMQIGLLFCEVLNTKKFKKNPANETAYKYFLELEEEHLRNRKRIKQKQDNEFDELIIAMVCDKGFPYDFDTINNLTIYDFNCCVQQVVKNVNYNNLMRGAYSGFGSVDLRKVKKSELNFLSFR